MQHLLHNACRILLLLYYCSIQGRVGLDFYWSKLAMIEVCSLARKISNDSMISALMSPMKLD